MASEYSSLIFSILGAIIALVSTQASALLNHFFTTKRENKKSDFEREASRREVLREKLEELMSALIAQLSDIQARSEFPTRLAALAVSGGEIPWVINEDSVYDDAILKAQMLVAVYFPTLISDVLELSAAAARYRNFVRTAFDEANKDPKKWIQQDAANYFQLSQENQSEYKDRLVDFQFKARDMLTEKLL